MNPHRQIIRQCQVWIVQHRLRFSYRVNVPVPAYPIAVPGGGFIMEGGERHGQTWHNAYNLVRANHVNVAYVFAPPAHSNHYLAPLFITEFEYGPPYFNGLIGILARRAGSCSFVPWCPSYPMDLFDDASSHDDSLPSDYEGDPEDSDLPSDYDSEDVYEAYLHSLLP